MTRALPLLLCLPSVAAAAMPSVAVMPFRDLAGGRGQVGEAIRETVTSDLKEVAGLRVIERAAIDQVIREQNLSARRNDLDAVASVRVGTLLGATLLVAGAYQKTGPSVRLTARFVKVETGEIVGTAKVDGPATELLTLQDRVTTELMRSAGLEPRKALPVRKRPRLKSWKTVELYGDAAVEPDPARRQQLLQLALDEDPDFVYAARDLEALQKRMAGYSRVSGDKLAEREHVLSSRFHDARLPAQERSLALAELFDALYAARRFNTLAGVAAPLTEPQQAADLREPATFRLFEARDRLHRVDLALQVGELYLSQFPTGAHFREVETRMHELVETRKKRDARRAEYEADLADKRRTAHGAELDYAPCIAARWNNQVNQLMLDGCSAFLARHANDKDKEGVEHAAAAHFFVVLALAEAGDFARARPLAEQLLADSDDWDEELRKLMSDWPTD